MFKKQVIILVDNGCNIYHVVYDIDKVPLEEMKELFGNFVENHGILREC